MEIASCTIVVACVVAAVLLALTCPFWFGVFLKIKDFHIDADDIFPRVQVQWRPVLVLAGWILFITLTVRDQVAKVAIIPCKHPQVVACR